MTSRIRNLWDAELTHASFVLLQKSEAGDLRERYSAFMFLGEGLHEIFRGLKRGGVMESGEKGGEGRQPVSHGQNMQMVLSFSAAIFTSQQNN